MTLIKLVDARRSLNLKCRELFRNEKIAESIYRFLCDGIEECEDFTPADVPNRKVGKWKHDGYDFPHGNDWIHCSVCGKRGINVPADLSNFCPNCGAKMEKEEDDETD